MAEIVFAFKKDVSVKEIGFRFNVSWHDGYTLFPILQPKPTSLPEVISLEEFKDNTGDQKYNSIVATPPEERFWTFFPTVMKTI